MVHLSSQAEADLTEFEDFVRKEPLVRECWMLSGEIDFVLKCVAPNLKTFQAFVAELTGAPHVRNVKTSLTLRNSKDAAMVPMELVKSAKRRHDLAREQLDRAQRFLQRHVAEHHLRHEIIAAVASTSAAMKRRTVSGEPAMPLPSAISSSKVGG